MANNSDYYRAQLEAQARGREHAQHIEEYARMCKMMIEESVPTNPSSRRTLCAIITPPCAGKTILMFTPPCACSVIRPSKQQWTFTLI